MFIVLFVFWLFLSAQFNIFHISAGIIFSLIVTYFAKPMFLNKPSDRGNITYITLRILRYVIWLIYQIFVSGIDVTKRVLKLNMPINPGIIKCKLTLKSDFSLTVLANSITLTPGTMTMDIVNDEIFIHCLAIEDEQKLIDSEDDFEDHIKKMLAYKDRGKIQ